MEVATALDRLVPAVSEIGRRLRKLPPVALIQLMNTYAKHRFEHEVNRQRGTAFDSGEAGFSHTPGVFV